MGFQTYRPSFSSVPETRNLSTCSSESPPRKLASALRYATLQQPPPSPKHVVAVRRAFFSTPLSVAEATSRGECATSRAPLPSSAIPSVPLRREEQTVGAVFEALVAAIMTDAVPAGASPTRFESTFPTPPSWGARLPERASPSNQQFARYNLLAFKLTRALKTSNAARCSSEPSASALRLRVAAVHERAKSLQALGRHADAVADFTDVLANSPGTVAAFFRRGLSLRALHRYAAAAVDLETARTVTRDDRFAVNYLDLHDVVSVAASIRGDEPRGAIVGLDGDADVAIMHLYVGAAE